MPALLPGQKLHVHVIFPSCFCNNLLNLLICPSLISKYLNCLTLSINSCHCCIAAAETINASFDLHMSLSLLLLSRRILIDLILTCKRSLSAFLLISDKCWATPVHPTQHAMHLFTGSMGHAQRTPLSEHAHRTS